MMASTFSKASVKSSADERAHFLRAQIVGVVIAAAEHVGAEDDAPFDLGAEPFLARPAIVVEQAGGVLRAMPVPHAVEAGEIRRSLGGGDDVVHADGVLGIRQRDFDDLGAERFVLPNGGANRGDPPADRCPR